MPSIWGRNSREVHGLSFDDDGRHDGAPASWGSRVRGATSNASGIIYRCRRTVDSSGDATGPRVTSGMRSASDHRSSDVLGLFNVLTIDRDVRNTSVAVPQVEQALDPFYGTY